MASKHQRTSISSSPAALTWDRAKFISEEAWKKYNYTIANKSLVPERGFRPDQRQDGELMAMIIERKWVHFTKPPESAIISMVRKFYANASVDGLTVVQVRGQAVAFDSKTINTLFAMPSYNVKDYMEQGIHSYDLDDIVKRLYKPRTVWETNQYTGEKTSFPHQALSRYGKAWYSSNIIPTHHHSDVTKERAILLFAIGNGLKVDIGVIIHDSILNAIKSSTSRGLPHPSLITRLCKQANIWWREDEIAQPPITAIDHHVISRFTV